MTVMKNLNKHIKLVIFVVFLLLLQSCKENADFVRFNADDAYVYFSLKNTNLGFKEELYMDSLSYSFALEKEEERDIKTLTIPLKIAGIPEDRDREVSFDIVKSESTIDLSKVSLGRGIIPANKVDGTLEITLTNYPALREANSALKLLLHENHEFKIGNEYNKSMKIIVSDQLTEPKWWKTWSRYFGPYYQEVYQKWMELYYLGADPSPEFYNPVQFPGPYYYWDRMPENASRGMHPVTFLYISRLKTYFQEHIIYPNADPTLPRILLP